MPAPPAAVARLAAGAQGGTAGVKAYDQAQTAVKGSTTKALGGIQDATAGFAGGTNGLMPSLQHEVAAPGGVALANLARFGAADRAATHAGQAGTSTYMDEANAAVPVIDAEARLNESQREAMLAASISRSSAATKAPKQLSDSQLRTDLLGAAERQRAEDAAQAQKLEAQRVMAQSEAAGGGANQTSAARAQLWGTPSNPSPVVSDPNAGPQPGGGASPLAGYVDTETARQQALQNIQQKQYGPGITTLAQEIAQPYVAQGLLDPNRIAGLLSPSYDRTLLGANEKLGLYQEPGKIANTAADPIATATQLGYDPKQYRAATSATYLDWNGDAHLKSALAKWTRTDPIGVKAAADAGGNEQAVQHAFLQNHPEYDNPKNIVQDVVQNAHSALVHGIDYQTFYDSWTHDPAALANPDAVRLGLSMVQQLFAYKQAQARQGAIVAGP